VRATPGNRVLIGVKLPRAPKQERELASYRDDNFGITLRSVTYIDRLRKEADPDEEGALVTGVDEGSWAALAGLAESDIIRSIDGVAVKDMESARARLRQLEKERSRRTLLFVSRGVRTLFVELQTDWSLPPAPVVKTAQEKTGK
jgi:S1-C subfamily serine protease